MRLIDGWEALREPKSGHAEGQYPEDLRAEEK